MKKILFLFLIVLATNAFAQQQKASPKPRWKYTGVVQGGLVAGSSEINYSAQTIQGVQKGSWVLGIGAGIDNYLMPGIPIIAHGQYNYGKRRSQPFVYAQAGPHIPWSKNEWNDKFMNTDLYKLNIGWLAEGGLGYRFPMGKKFKLLTSIGYSIKQAKYDELQYPWGWPISSRWPPEGILMNPTYYHQKLTMNRLVLKVGVQF